MTRVACLTFHKGENLLLLPWVLYHGYLFGFENIFIFCDCPDSELSKPTFLELISLGVKIEYSSVNPKDSADEDYPVSLKIHEFKQGKSYDIAIPLACEEFVAVFGADGPICSRTLILDELAKVADFGIAARTAFCLDSRPGFADLFRHIEYMKCIIAVNSFLGIDTEHKRATLPDGRDFTKTDILLICMQGKPFTKAVASARQELETLIDISDIKALKEFSGPNRHLTKYLLMSREEYYEHFHGYALPVIRFRGLLSVLGIFVATADFRWVWEQERPDFILDNLIEIDIDAVKFNTKDYVSANPDLPKSGFDCFHHFVMGGYLEGRRLSPTPAGNEEVVNRLASFRRQRKDGVAGYKGLAHAAQRVGTLTESEPILLAAFERFGYTSTLMREYDLLAAYDGRHQEAATRWESVISRYPDNIDGYLHGIGSNLKLGNVDAAQKIADAALTLFPSNRPIMMSVGEIYASRREWLAAKELFEKLAREDPKNRAASEKASWASYHLRLSLLDDDTSVDNVYVMDAPVAVAMSATETADALRRLGVNTIEELRDIFLRFESIGHSCEFGLVQRRFGAEPLGLLRWNSIHFQKLVQALDERFDALVDATNLATVIAGNELILRDLRYRTSMHTFFYVNEITEEVFMKKQSQRVGYLRRKLIEDLELGEKIFVHLDDISRPLEEIVKLHRAVRSYGSGELLYVAVSDSPARAGTLSRVKDGLLVGYLKRLGRDAAGSWIIDFDTWLEIIRNALAETSKR